ncbi:MAG: hypothetical protein AAF495_19700 [Pseudomonadota bacterium]
MFKKLSLALVTVVLGLCAAHQVLASPISYVVRGNAAGTIGTNTFGFTDFLIAMTADTTTIQNVSGGRTNLTTSAVFSLVEMSLTFEVTVPLTVFVDQTNSQLSLTTPSISDPLIVLPNSAYATYGLDTDLGPVASAVPMFFGFTMGLPTQGGTVTISAMAENPNFEADLNPEPNIVPEPGALWLFALGLAALSAMAWPRPQVPGRPWR